MLLILSSFACDVRYEANALHVCLATLQFDSLLLRRWDAAMEGGFFRFQLRSLMKVRKPGKIGYLSIVSLMACCHLFLIIFSLLMIILILSIFAWWMSFTNSVALCLSTLLLTPSLGAFVYCWILWRMGRLRARGQFFSQISPHLKPDTIRKIHTPTVEFSVIGSGFKASMLVKCACTRFAKRAQLYHGYTSWNSKNVRLFSGSSHFMS